METTQPHYAVVFDTETANIGSGQENPALMIEAAYLAFERIENPSPVLTFHQRYNPFPAEFRETPMKAGLMGYGALATHHILPPCSLACPRQKRFICPPVRSF